MNMLNSNAAKIDTAAPSQASTPAKPEEIKTSNLVLAKDGVTPKSIAEPVSLPAGFSLP